MSESRTLQVRRYRITPERFDDYVAWWQENIPALRGEVGFVIEFAALGRETSEFLWGVSSEGDRAAFREREERYMNLPHRLAVFEGVAAWVEQSDVTFMTPIGPGAGRS